MVVLNIIVMLLLALFVVWLLLNLRARHLDQQDGAFRAWARLDSHSGWMSGIAFLRRHVLKSLLLGLRQLMSTLTRCT